MQSDEEIPLWCNEECATVSLKDDTVPYADKVVFVVDTIRRYPSPCSLDCDAFDETATVEVTFLFYSAYGIGGKQTHAN